MQARAAQVVILAACFAVPRASGEPAQRVVLLRNGNVLVGEVDPLGDVYRVRTDTSEIRLPGRDVQCVVATLHDAYAACRGQVRPDVAVDRLRLATWCIRQELWAEAEHELAEAKAIAPSLEDIELLERRLEVLSRAAMRAARQQQAESTSSTEAEANPQANLAELESLVGELPPGSLENFARHVQPILVNGCAAGGCHSESDPRQFRLNRDLVRGVATRESTLRNLQAAWNAIDHTTPDHSPLLLQPAVPHGGLPRPVFAGHRTKVQERLVEWVRQATGTLPKPEMAPPAATNVELADYEQQSAGGPRVASQAAGTADGEHHFWDDPAALGLDEDQPPSQPAQQIRYGATPKKFEPRDEFDPELFNRRVENEGE